MFFDNTTDRAARRAIERAHTERGKIPGELWVFLMGRAR